MKREYRVADELGKQRSIDKFRALAAEGASVQLVLPLAEVMLHGVFLSNKVDGSKTHQEYATCFISSSPTFDYNSLNPQDGAKMVANVLITKPKRYLDDPL